MTDKEFERAQETYNNYFNSEESKNYSFSEEDRQNDTIPFFSSFHYLMAIDFATRYHDSIKDKENKLLIVDTMPIIKGDIDVKSFLKPNIMQCLISKIKDFSTIDINKNNDNETLYLKDMPVINTYNDVDNIVYGIRGEQPEGPSLFCIHNSEMNFEFGISYDDNNNPVIGCIIADKNENVLKCIMLDKYKYYLHLIPVIYDTGIGQSCTFEKTVEGINKLIQHEKS